MHQQVHNDAAQDGAKPNASRGVSREHVAGKEARGDANADRGSHGHGRK